MKWFFLIVVTVICYVVGLVSHSILWFLLAGILFFSGLFIFDALENGGSQDEFLDAITRMLEKFIR